MNNNIEYKVMPRTPSNGPFRPGIRKDRKERIRRGPVIINDDTPEIPEDKPSVPYVPPYENPRIRRDRDRIPIPISNDFPRDYRYL